MKIDKARLRTEVKKLGCDTWGDVARAAGLAEYTITRSLRPNTSPSVHLLAWLVQQGVDLRKVWIPA